MRSALQASFPKIERAAANKNLAVSLALFLSLVAASASIAAAETKKNCECEFDTKDYDAYGTNGACGIHMYNKARTCEVAFSGTGINTKLLKKTLGDLAVQNQFTVAPQIFEQYVAYNRDGEKGRFLDASFIETSLIVLARAALFRESSAGGGVPLEEIDAMFVDFSKKSSKQIAETFRGAKPFEVKMAKDSVFSVGQGYVELNFQNSAAIVRVVYFSDPR